MTGTTRSERHIDAPRELVYRLLTDSGAVRKWKVPDGMSSKIHEFDAREGGRFRVSLTYSSPEPSGKTGEHTDTYHGRFVSLAPPERVVETMEFETEDPAMRGEMTVTYTLSAAGGGTDLVAVHEGLPSASRRRQRARVANVPDKLAALAEGTRP